MIDTSGRSRVGQSHSYRELVVLSDENIAQARVLQAKAIERVRVQDGNRIHIDNGVRKPTPEDKERGFSAGLGEVGFKKWGGDAVSWSEDQFRDTSRPGEYSHNFVGPEIDGWKSIIDVREREVEDEVERISHAGELFFNIRDTRIKKFRHTEMIVVLVSLRRGFTSSFRNKPDVHTVSASVAIEGFVMMSELVERVRMSDDVRRLEEGRRARSTGGYMENLAWEFKSRILFPPRLLHQYLHAGPARLLR